MSEAKVVSSEVGTRLLFENDRVRVWDLRLEPGESTGQHRHEADYLYIVIGDGELQTVYANGTSDPPRQMKDGDVRFREVSEKSSHEAVNTGKTPWRNIVVELKDPRAL
jgi:quercetin dioxygenase-like cupin family protein